MVTKHSPLQPQSIAPQRHQSDTTSASNTPFVPTSEMTTSSFPIPLSKRFPKILQRFSIIDIQRVLGNRNTTQLLRAISPLTIHRKTVLSGSGNFCLSDASGNEHTLSVAGSRVYSGTGKGKIEIGTIDVTGNYAVMLDGKQYQGSLADLKPGAANVSIAEKSGKKTLQAMEIGKEKIASGEIHLPDGIYTIQDNQIYYRTKIAPVGAVSVIRTHVKSKRLNITAIPYNYIDRSGKMQSGDLLTEVLTSDPDAAHKVTPDPREETYLEFGKGGTWMSFVDKQWSTLRHTSSGWGGFEQSAGGRLETTLRTLLKEQGGKLHVEGREVALSNDEIDLFQAVAEVETSGLTNSVNTWDSDVVSMGFMQYTLAGKLQDLIRRAPSAFARYGIKLGGTLTINSKKGKPQVEGIDGVTTDRELRGPIWATRFLQAGLDKEIIAAQVERAKERDLPKVTAQISRLPVQSIHAKRILLELFNNREGYLKKVMDRTLKQVKVGVSEKEFLDELHIQVESIYVEDNKDGKNGKTNGKPDDVKARAKARRLLAKTNL